jgi:hypothetical protein
VHEAGHVDAGEHVGFGVEDVVELEGAHLAGDVREGDGKRAAEAAALFLLAEGDDLGVFDGGQQGADGLAGLVPRLWQERWKAMRVGVRIFPGQVLMPRPL